MPGTNPHHTLQQFLHPKVPPNSGSGPSVDELSLFWKDDEEDEETKEFRRGAGVITADELKGAGTSSRTNGSGAVMETHPVNSTTEEQGRTPNGTTASSVTTTAQPAYQTLHAAPQYQNSTPSSAQAGSTLMFSHNSQPAPTLPTPQLAQSSTIPQNSQPEPSSAIGSSTSGTPFASSSGISRTLPTTSAPLPSSVTAQNLLGTLAPDGDDDDEPMPEINLASDTDEDKD